MNQNDLDLNCSVCDKKFTPRHEHDFVCAGCIAALVCVCGSDDVQMQWDVDCKGGYNWEIECHCGRNMRSQFVPLDKHDQASKDLHAEWVSSLNQKPV